MKELLLLLHPLFCKRIQEEIFQLGIILGEGVIAERALAELFNLASVEKLMAFGAEKSAPGRSISIWIEREEGVGFSHCFIFSIHKILQNQWELICDEK